MLTYPIALLLLAAAGLMLAVEMYQGWRSRQAATVLGLPPHKALSRRLLLGTGTVALLALAASQPVIGARQASYMRNDAEVWVILDTSGSMMASHTPTSPTRYSRALNAADRVFDSLPSNLPVGAAGMQQDVLPLAAPTVDRTLDKTALAQLARPGLLPERTMLTGLTATWFASLADLGKAHFFRPSVKKRVAILLSDGEGPTFIPDSTLVPIFDRHIKLIVVRFGSPTDRLWLHSKGQIMQDSGFHSNTSDIADLKHSAKKSGGAFYSEQQLGQAIAKAKSLVGDGKSRKVGVTEGGIDLAPYLFLLTLPLLLFQLGGISRRIEG